MNSFQSIALGIVQGLTEFLPVSSSGHLVMAQTLLGVEQPGVFFDVMLHVATLVAVLIVYRERLAAITGGILRREPGALRYFGLLLLASVPAGLVGVLFKDRIEQIFSMPAFTGVALILTGFILWSTRYARKAFPAADGGQPVATAADDVGAVALGGNARLTWKQALGIGLAQAVAILPGISRSGSTITAGLWGRLRGEAAAEFSFLMSVVVISGAALLEARHLGDSVEAIGIAPIAGGFIAALVTGILSIRSLVWLLRKQAFYAFSYYVWIAGGLFLLYLGTRG